MRASVDELKSDVIERMRQGLDVEAMAKIDEEKKLANPRHSVQSSVSAAQSASGSKKGKEAAAGDGKESNKKDANNKGATAASVNP